MLNSKQEKLIDQLWQINNEVKAQLGTAANIGEDIPNEAKLVYIFHKEIKQECQNYLTKKSEQNIKDLSEAQWQELKGQLLEKKHRFLAKLNEAKQTNPNKFNELDINIDDIEKAISRSIDNFLENKNFKALGLENTNYQNRIEQALKLDEHRQISTQEFLSKQILGKLSGENYEELEKKEVFWCGVHLERSKIKEGFCGENVGLALVKMFRYGIINKDMVVEQITVDTNKHTFLTINRMHNDLREYAIKIVSSWNDISIEVPTRKNTVFLRKKSEKTWEYLFSFPPQLSIKGDECNIEIMEPINSTAELIQNNLDKLQWSDDSKNVALIPLIPEQKGFVIIDRRGDPHGDSPLVSVIPVASLPENFNSQLMEIWNIDDKTNDRVKKALTVFGFYMQGDKGEISEEKIKNALKVDSLNNFISGNTICLLTAEQENKLLQAIEHARLSDMSTWGRAIIFDSWMRNGYINFASTFGSIFKKNKLKTLRFTVEDKPLLNNITKLDNYFYMTGNTDPEKRRPLLIDEYKLISLEKPRLKEIKTFLYDLSKQLRPKNFYAEVEIFITTGGTQMVRPISGFQKPAIAIHKDFLENLTQSGEYSLEELQFGLARALFCIKHHPSNYGEDLSANDERLLDELVIQQINNADYAKKYLQHSIEFEKQHNNEINFKIPDTYFVLNKGSYKQRIKDLEMFLAQSKHEHCLVTKLPTYLDNILCQQLIDFKTKTFFTEGFDNAGDRVTKINYLKSCLPELKIELFPLELNKYQPSVRVTEFCHLLRELKVSTNELQPDHPVRRTLDSLVDEAFQKRIPCFESIYRAILGTEENLSKKTPHLKFRLGIFDHFYNALKAFCNAKTFEEAVKQAQLIKKYQKRLKNHLHDNLAVKRANYLNKYKMEHGGLLPTGADRYFSSSIGAYTTWPNFKIKLNKKYSIQRISKRKFDRLSETEKEEKENTIFLISRYDNSWLISCKDPDGVEEFKKIAKKDIKYSYFDNYPNSIGTEIFPLDRPWQRHLKWIVKKPQKKSSKTDQRTTIERINLLQAIIDIDEFSEKRFLTQEKKQKLHDLQKEIHQLKKSLSTVISTKGKSKGKINEIITSSNPEDEEKLLVAKTLWEFYGITRDPELWQAVTDEGLDQMLKIPPIQKLPDPFSHFSYVEYSSKTELAILQYQSDKHILQKNMFSDEQLSFEEAFKQFFDTNIVALKAPGIGINDDNQTIHCLLDKFADIAQNGTREEKEVIRSFFLGRKDCRDLKSLCVTKPFFPEFDYRHLYMQFLIEQQYNGKEFAIFTRNECLKTSPFFMGQKIEDMSFKQLRTMFRLSHIPLDLNCFEQLISLFFEYFSNNKRAFEKLMRRLSTIILDWRCKNLLNANALRIVKLIYNYNIALLPTTTRQILNSFSWPLKNDFEKFNPDVNDLITLYIVCNKHMAFSSVFAQEKFGKFVLRQINTINNRGERIAALEKLLFAKFSYKVTSAQKFTSPPLSDITLRNQLLKQWVKAIIIKFKNKKDPGDNSNNYYKEMLKIIDRVNEDAPNRDKIRVLSELANTIEAQQPICNYIKRILSSGKFAKFVKIGSSMVTQVFSILTQDDNFRKTKEIIPTRIKVVNFLSAPITEKSIDLLATHLISQRKARKADEILRIFEFDEHAMDTAEKKDILNLILPSIYRLFWDTSLKIRAVLINHLLIPAGKLGNDATEQQAYEEAFKYVAYKLFPGANDEEHPNHKDDEFAVKILQAYLKTADKYERGFLLSAMLVTTGEKQQRASMGKKLALLCEHMGPAYIKLAQAIHSHPDTPQDIHKDLDHIKGHANPPYRWQLWSLIDRTLPPEETKDNIKRLGRLLGSASYYLAVEVTLQDGSNAVLTLLRKNARRDAKKGFEHLIKTIAECKHARMDTIKEPATSMVKEAQCLSKIEMDHKCGDQQQKIANQIYDNTPPLEVIVNNIPYIVTLKSVTTLKSGRGYRLMTRAYGPEFNDLSYILELATSCDKHHHEFLKNVNLFDQNKHQRQLALLSEVERNKILSHLNQIGNKTLPKVTELRSSLENIKPDSKYARSIREWNTYRKAIAKAVMTTELTNILSGSHFDCDRHGSQYRIDLDKNNPHAITLGLYDFGEMTLLEGGDIPTAQGLDRMAEIILNIYDIITNKDTAKINNNLNSKIDSIFQQQLEQAKQKNEQTRYLMQARKAILALQDFQRCLDNDELLEVFKTVSKSDRIHQIIKNAFNKIVGKIIIEEITKSFKNFFEISLNKLKSSFWNSQEEVGTPTKKRVASTEPRDDMRERKPDF